MHKKCRGALLARPSRRLHTCADTLIARPYNIKTNMVLISIN